MSFKVENQDGEEIEIRSPVFGFYVSGDKKMFVLSDDPPAEIWSSTFKAYIANPGDHSWHDRLFLIGMGHFGTRFLVWAKHDGDAIEEAAEAALDAGMKGFFNDDAQMKELYNEAREDLGPDASDEAVMEQAEADLTYTESGWITAYEWSLDEVTSGERFGQGEDLYGATKYVCEAYTSEEEPTYDLEPNRRGKHTRNAPHYDDYIISVPRMSAQRRLVYGYNPDGDAWGSMIGLAKGYDSEKEAFDWCQSHAFQRGKQSALVFREKHGGDVVQLGHVGETHRGGSYQPNARGATIEKITSARVTHYKDNNETRAYVGWVDQNGKRGETTGLASGAHMQALLARAKREGVKVVRDEAGWLPNARGGALDENAARELELFIENDYDLVGKGNSKGKMIEKNLQKKIKQGKYDYTLSVKLWEYLIEDGARKYAKEFSVGTDWSKIFSPATRRFVADRFAQHFAQENGVAHRGPTASVR